MRRTTLIVRRLPASRHSFSTYDVWIDGVNKGKLPPAMEPETIEQEFELDPGPHKIAISIKSLDIDLPASQELEINADGTPITLETTAYIRGILWWLEPFTPWLWFIGFTKNEVTIKKVN